MKAPPLRNVINRLSRLYPGSNTAPFSEPWKLILWENAAYLADDARRRAAFDLLEELTGLVPKAILRAPDAKLEKVCAHGIVAKKQAEKLRTCAEIAQQEFGGSLKEVMSGPPAAAKKALKRFPGIGDPGADKILLLCRKSPVLALESNGLRVLLRLGFGTDHKNYATAYKSMQHDIAAHLPDDFDWLIGAHLLLRKHGQTLCKRELPDCFECPLRGDCSYRRKIGDG